MANVKKYIRAIKEHATDLLKKPSKVTKVKRVVRDNPFKSAAAVGGVVATGAAGTYAYKQHKSGKPIIPKIKK